MQNNEIEILIVEDNLYDAELTIRALRKQNLANKLIHLRDGAEALDFLFANGKYASRNPDFVPRVVFLDLKMPKVDGIEVLRKIKSDPRTRSIPVVILTSSAEDPDVKRCYDLGANSYIVKPVEFENFVRIVTDLGLYWIVINKTS
ncbi:MAG: response regulator [Cyclobacteriaceae bacterium]|jgi:two-component system response regulator|nr:response regulator [Cyclobacteriaceae bacterium]